MGAEKVNTYHRILPFVEIMDSTLRDGEQYAMIEEEDQKGALFSEGQILVSG